MILLLCADLCLVMFLWKYRIYEHVSFCLVRVDNIISCICACPHVCGYTCICVCEDMNLMSAVFLNCFSPCSLRYSLSRNQELTDLTALASLLVSDPLCLPREPGLWAVTTPAQLFYVGSEDLHSGVHTCKTATLSIRPCL